MPKTVKLITILTICFLFGIMKIHGQSPLNLEPEKQVRHGIGAAAGFVTGYGLSYRFTPSKFGMQFNFAPYHSKDIDRYSLGITFMYKLIDNKSTNLYLYQGNHFYYNSEKQYYLDSAKNSQTSAPNSGNSNTIEERIKENYFNNGIGVGIEIIIVKKIGFNIMAGYGAYKNFEELNFTGETGLYYKF